MRCLSCSVNPNRFTRFALSSNGSTHSPGTALIKTSGPQKGPRGCFDTNTRTFHPMETVQEAED
uniref:Uncharacterized protein n=1 Tax=Anguilla anguilla TaxID=7936 RepID=A0A0E9Q686_ANGAN